MDDAFEDLTPAWLLRRISRKNDYFGRAFPVVCKDTNEIAHNYREYLATEHWRKLKKRFYNSKMFKGPNYRRKVGGMRGGCFVCSRTSGLQVHHNTYRRLGREHLVDLLAMCFECHKNVHKEYDKLIKEDPSRSKELTLRDVWLRLPKMKKKIKKARALRIEERKAKRQKRKARDAWQSARDKARNLRQKRK